MELSLSEAARLLGKSERQVRYLISSGKLRAKKAGRRWWIRRDDLPLSAGQQKAADQKEARSLELEVRAASGGKRLSVKKLRAYQVGMPLYRDLRDAVGAEHSAVALLRESLALLACGYFEYHGRQKSDYYRRAREHASRAAMTLMLDGDGDGAELVERFEDLLMPAIGGLIRKSERWGSKR